MFKLLSLAIIFVLIYFMLKRYRNTVDQPPPPFSVSEDMVQCAYCHIHLPKNESIKEGALHYCSEAHRQQHRP